MTGVHKKRENLDPDMPKRRTPCEEEGRDEGDVFISSGMPKIGHKSPEGRTETGNGSTCHISQKKSTTRTP